MPRVICYGEVLWDLLPSGEFLGGAPLNVAYHLAQLGLSAEIVSAVGQDRFGENALASLRHKGVDTGNIAVHPTLPTGTAEVTLSAEGHASYRLPAPVAWDEITGARVQATPPASALVFGSLALRHPANRIHLRHLLDLFPQAEVICDLNLRPPFDDLAPLTPVLQRARLLKLNDDEAVRLVGTGSPEVQTTRLREKFGIPRICLTLGAQGAFLRVDDQTFRASPPRIKVADTIGAGDAFTAGFIAAWLAQGQRPDWPTVLTAGCRLGAFVASHPGAQPSHESFGRWCAALIG